MSIFANNIRAGTVLSTKKGIHAKSSKLLTFFLSCLKPCITSTLLLPVYILCLFSGLWMPIASKQKQVHLRLGQVLIEPCLQAGQKTQEI